MTVSELTIHYFRSYVRAKGYPPMVREIAAHFQISDAATRKRLKYLVKAGVLKHTPLKQRGYTLNAYYG